MSDALNNTDTDALTDAPAVEFDSILSEWAFNAYQPIAAAANRNRNAVGTMTIGRKRDVLISLKIILALANC